MSDSIFEFDNFGSGHVWLDGNDIVEVNKWVDSDGRELSFTPFGAGEPNGGSIENCLHTNIGHVHWGTGIWNDYPCSYTNNCFACRLGFSCSIKYKFYNH